MKQGHGAVGRLPESRGRACGRRRFRDASGHDWAPYFRACDSGADRAADAWRGFVCRNYLCGCPAYQELCEPLPYTHCTDPQTDANHCGSCLNSCIGGESCVEGVCR